MTKDVREPLKDGVTKITSGRTGKVRYECRWSHVGPDGTRRHERATRPTLKAARAHRARMVAAIAEGRHGVTTRLTVAEYAETWFARRERAWASSTVYARRRQWERHVKPRLGHLRIAQVTRPQCQAMADDLSAQYRSNTVEGIMAVVTGLLRSAVRDELIPRNVAEELDIPKSEPHQPNAWSALDAVRFLDATADHPDHALYWFLVGTGARIGEALALRWRDVDLDGGVVTIENTLRIGVDGTPSIGAGTKTSPGRVVTLPAGCVAALRRHQDAEAERRRTAKTWDIGGYVFAGPQGQHRWPDQAGDILRRVQDGMGEGWTVLTFHELRHTCATLLMRAKTNPLNVKNLLGHKTVQMTLDTYTHPDQDDLAGASALLDAMLSGTTIDKQKA